MRMLLVIVLIVLFAAVAFAQRVPIVGFQCKDGVCWTDEEQLTRLQQMLDMIAARFTEMQAEIERVKRTCKAT